MSSYTFNFAKWPRLYFLVCLITCNYHPFKEFIPSYYFGKFIFIVFYYCLLQLSAFSLHPSHPAQPNPPASPASTLPLGFVHVSFILVPEKPTHRYPLPTPFWLLLLVSGYTLFAFFLLLIMFQLKVRSYGICPSPPGLFHLA